MVDNSFAPYTVAGWNIIDHTTPFFIENSSKIVCSICSKSRDELAEIANEPFATLFWDRDPFGN